MTVWWTAAVVPGTDESTRAVALPASSLNANANVVRPYRNLVLNASSCRCGANFLSEARAVSVIVVTAGVDNWRKSGKGMISACAAAISARAGRERHLYMEL